MAHALPATASSTSPAECEPAWQPIEHLHGTVSIDGATHDVPYTIAQPVGGEAEATAVIVPGYGCFKRTSRAWRDALAATQGLAAVSYDPARIDHRNFGLRDLLDPQALHLATVEAVVDELDEQRAETHKRPLVLLAHSMGSLAASDYAIRHPDRISAVIYFGGVGLGSPKIPELAWRGLQEMTDDVMPAAAQGKFGYSPVIGQRTLMYFLQNPLRSLGEALSCGQANLLPRLQFLAQAGVRQAIVGFEHDRFFPPAEIERAARPYVDVIRVLDDATHLAPQRQPQRIARVTGELLRALALS